MFQKKCAPILEEIKVLLFPKLIKISTSFPKSKNTAILVLGTPGTHSLAAVLIRKEVFATPPGALWRQGTVLLGELSRAELKVQGLVKLHTRHLCTSWEFHPTEGVGPPPSNTAQAQGILLVPGEPVWDFQKSSGLELVLFFSLAGTALTLGNWENLFLAPPNTPSGWTSISIPSLY